MGGINRDFDIDCLAAKCQGRTVHAWQIVDTSLSRGRSTLCLPSRTEHDEEKRDEKKPQPDKDSSINNLFHAEYDNFCF